MKGVLLAGGLGTRLYPLTRVVNKHTLPVYSRPMFYYPLQTLIDSGIKEIAIVSGPPFGEQIKKLVSYASLPSTIKVDYVNQPKPLGMADGILRCHRYLGNSNLFVIAGDNFYAKNFWFDVECFKDGALSFLRKVKDPQRYGVPFYDSNRRLIKIKEKPKFPKTNWIVSGPHFFDKNVFSLIKKLSFSNRGELEITDLNNLYLKDGKLRLIKRTDFWADMGTFDSLLEVANFVKKQRR